MQGLARKIVFVTLYELIAIACITAGLALLAGQPPSHAGVAAVMSSLIAISWNFLYNLVFEAWEKRQATRGRNIRRRVVHALGYEGVLLLVGIPLYAWWLEVSLASAFVLNIGFVVFFLFYSFLYTWAFDIVFGLPSSAQGGKSSGLPASE